ncbi:peroxiredoxin [Blastomonas sp.]|uniref:peroxiredoxin n=1 Tax=Blastomonas sp. TaxID=1909299 RepID=UPI00391926E7
MNMSTDPVPPVRIGDGAPDFTARTTQGEKALHDFRGRWLVFFSHPADFTPVCTTEFIGMQRAAAQFEAMDCALLGLSVDSLYAHHAWLRAIRDSFGVSISFPVVEDPSMAVGRAYGMIDDSAGSSVAMRSTFFIDPTGVVRAITTYPHNVGRSVAEMLRLLAALQRSDDGSVMIPEGWQPGDDLLRAPDPAGQPAEGAADWFCQKVAAT